MAHDQVHGLIGNDHVISGLQVGHALKATSSSTVGFSELTKAEIGLGNVTDAATDDTAYSSVSWNSNNDAATKNALRDEIEKIYTLGIAPNTAHRISDGSGHANVALNDTHRGVTSGNPHSVTAANVGLGTGDSPTFTALTISNGQIVFPATQVPSGGANVLDDYAEGTWTPGISFGLGTTGITYSAQLATYTKIGRVVVVTGRVVLSNKGSSTGTMRITGLPFTIGVGNQNFGVGGPCSFYSAFGARVAAGVIVQGVPNQTHFDLTTPNAATGATLVLNDTDATNTSQVNFVATYMV